MVLGLIAFSIVLLTGMVIYQNVGQTESALDEEQENVEPFEEESKEISKKDEEESLTAYIDNLGDVTFAFESNLDGQTLALKVNDSEGQVLYQTPDGNVGITGCGINIENIVITDLNGDTLVDVVIEYSSYNGAGYLGGLDYKQVFVLLQEEGHFVHDQALHDMLNHNLIDTDHRYVEYYYAKDDNNTPVYSSYPKRLHTEDEYTSTSVYYPQIKAEPESFRRRVQDMIDMNINEKLYQFMGIEDFYTVSIAYDITRNDHLLSMKYHLDWYVDGTAHPNLELRTVNIDMNTCQFVNAYDILPDFYENATEIFKLCRGVEYAGMKESMISDAMKNSILESKTPYSIYLSDEMLTIVIPTNHASGSYIELLFKIGDLDEFIEYEGI